MPRKAKVNDEVKIKEVLNYLNGSKSIIEISKEVGISPEQVRRWIITYKSSGIEGLKNKSTNKYYSTETNGCIFILILIAYIYMKVCIFRNKYSVYNVFRVNAHFTLKETGLV